MDKKYVMSWRDYHKAMQNLVKTLEGTAKPTYVVPILRGGMLPGLSLALHYNAKIGMIRVVKYGDIERPTENEPRIVWHSIDFQWLTANDQILIVDDIVDSGDTMSVVKRFIRGNAPKSTIFGVCCVKKEDKHPATNPDTVVSGVIFPEDVWISFPWERMRKSEDTGS